MTKGISYEEQEVNSLRGKRQRTGKKEEERAEDRRE